MASSDFWQRLSASVASSADWEAGLAGNSARGTRGTIKLWMTLDALTVIGAATLATMYELHTGPVAGARGLWHGTLFRVSSRWILLGLLCGFIISLLITSRRLNLYYPTRMSGFLSEQRWSFQACLTSGLLLTGSLYLIHADDIPRSIVHHHFCACCRVARCAQVVLPSAALSPLRSRRGHPQCAHRWHRS